MKNIFSISVLIIALTILVGCGVSGKYHTETGNSSYTLNEAPLKLKPFGKARWTHYAMTTSTSYKYYEDVKYKKKNDTLFLRRRAIYGDTAILGKQYVPKYLIKGDTLQSIEWDLKYVKD